MPNMWDQVDDFKWLKEAPSPNWSLLADEDMLQDDIWSSILDGETGASAKDLLRKVGIPAST